MLLSTYLALPPMPPRPANEEAATPMRRAVATIVPFPAARPPRIRRAAETRRGDAQEHRGDAGEHRGDAGERRGEILLFLGVRYERRAS